MACMSLKLLVTGLTALVPVGGNDVAVLFPAIPEMEGMPAHRPFLGYMCDEWELCGNLEPYESEGRCFLDLTEYEVILQNARALRTKDPRMHWFKRVILGRSCPGAKEYEIQAIDWIPEFSRIERNAEIDPSCLGRNEYNLITARGRFEFSRMQSCFMEGLLHANGEFEVPQCAFKVPGAEGSRLTQALSAGVMYDIELAACDPLPRIVVRRIYTGEEVTRLVVKEDVLEKDPREAHIALLHLINDVDANNSHADSHPCIDVNAGSASAPHFAVYYKLLDVPPRADQLAFPGPSDRDSTMIRYDLLKEACQSDFINDSSTSFSETAGAEQVVLEPDFIPPGVVAPEGYKAGPPLCTPVQVGKGD